MYLNDFDLIAPIYDWLSRLIFQNKILEAQTHHLGKIQPNDGVLILGGGTGKLLEALPVCNKIDYVEKSHKMLLLAKKRVHLHKVNFIESDFFCFSYGEKYDVIICPFFLDCFNERNLKAALKKCEKLLTNNGTLIVSDFQKVRSNRIILKSMHLFFRFISKLEARKLLDIHQTILSSKFVLIEEKFFHQNQLFSRLYRNL